jgi:SPP1 family predicted phage head-tail adaptor
MRTGTLRHIGVIERLVAASPQQDAGGEPDESWQTFSTVRCAMEPLQGRELVAAQQTESETTGRVRMRYLSGVTTKMRFKFEGRYFDILAVVDTRERHREMVLTVREGLNNG